MGLLFNRRYKLLVGETNTLGLLITNIPETDESDGVTQHSLHMDFTITKTDKVDEKNKAVITVFNLSKESIAKIEKDQKVTFDAGYDGDQTRTIFLGQVEDVFSEVSGETVKTRITCIDGYVPVREGYTSRTFSGKSTVETMLRTIITQDLGFANPVMKNGILGADKGLNKVFQNGTAKVGDSAEIITSLCRDNFLTWMIRDGEVIIYPVDGSTDIELPLISASSGMIGSPQKSQINKNKLKKSKDLKTTYKVKTLLQGSYNIGDLVQIESAFTNGTYRITKLTHKGSYDGSAWFTNLVVAEGVAK